MEYSIQKVRAGDEQILAYIQTESWKSAFINILDKEVLERCTDLERVTSMYRRLLTQDAGNGYILKVENKPHCIAWWDKSRQKDMPGYAELICIHSLPDNRRKGYGSRMMDRVLSDMAQAGYSKVMLWVFRENRSARKFYEANGFFTEGRQKPDIVPVEICYERDISHFLIGQTTWRNGKVVVTEETMPVEGR